MRVLVDLGRCQDHGQCVYSAPGVFVLDDNGRLAFRAMNADPNTGTHTSPDIDESLRGDVEEAADACPVQAITVLD